MRARFARTSLAVSLATLATACSVATTQATAEWPPLAKKWFDRAAGSYHDVDLDDAQLSIENALRIDPNRADIRLLEGRIALSELDYDRAIRSVEGLDSSDARGIRGRALWYSGQVDRAADELEQLVADPEVRDPWAEEVAKLARRGAGRQPFRMTGGALAVAEMPAVGGGSFVVPVELDGEPVLALVATGTPEVVVDSGSGRQASWVSLRFGDRLEVHDVPALTKDLTGISRQLNAPIKVLFGVNLLRHIHPTIDFQGSQFVVRANEPEPPPRATTLHLGYIRGGGMVFRTNLGTSDASAASLLIDTAMQFPLALDEDGWKKAGVATSALTDIPNSGRLKQGVVSHLMLGAFDVPHVPGVFGAPIDEYEKALAVNLDGLVGAGLLGAFRLTIGEGGRVLWLEDNQLPDTSESGPTDDDSALSPQNQSATPKSAPAPAEPPKLKLPVPSGAPPPH